VKKYENESSPINNHQVWDFGKRYHRTQFLVTLPQFAAEYGAEVLYLPAHQKFKWINVE
jgi:hypothetical protein